ncbi:MAG: ester cyclase [Thermoleophilia bacterium]|nr:ester cyclase [Thermoleophilia bacterium]
MADLKAMTQEMFDALRSGSDIDAAIDTYLAEDFVEHEDVPGMDNTRETPRQLFKMMHAAFSDFRINVLDLLQEGDKVVARITMAGTHDGEFMGVPASGKQMEINAIEILQFRDDKSVAHWGVMDMATMMEQIGATGAPS